MSEIETDMKKMDLKSLSEDGCIRLVLKAKDTEVNQAVYEGFKEFCKIETDNNYTVGLRKLLEFYQMDYRNELIVNEINDLRVVLAEIKTSVEGIVKKEVKVEEKNDQDSF